MRQLLTDLRGNPIYSFAQRRLGHRRNSNRHVHAHEQSTLFCMVVNRSWDDVLRRSKSHPAEVLLQDHVTGNTPLHVACRLDPPPQVIQALGATCRVKNHEGATAVHIAASQQCSAAALGALLELASKTPREYEELSEHHPTADLSRMGRAPIHYACMSFRGLELDAFRLLFEATLKDGNVTLDSSRGLGLDDFIDEEEFDELEEQLEDNSDYWNMAPPSEDRNEQEDSSSKVTVNVMAMKDATGQTPLGLLFRRYRERVRVVIKTVDRIRNENGDRPDQAALASAMTVHADLGELWEKARWIVARLTEERLQREGGAALGGAPLSHMSTPGETSQQAASWAAEQYQSHELLMEHESILPVSEDMQLMLPPVAEDSNNSGKSSNSNNNSNRQFRIVHASVGLTGYGCPPEMVRLAISIHPKQVMEMDEDGNLPIHIAATASSYVSSNELPSATTVAMAVAAAEGGGGDNADNMSVLSDAAMSFFSSASISQTTNPFDKVIKILLQNYPQGAKIPQGRSGRLPLVMAIESGRRTWEDGIRTLLNAYPPAMHNKKLFDPVLYPNVLALVASGRRPDPDDFLPFGMRPGGSKLQRREAGARSTIFDLLRTKPEWLEPAADKVMNPPKKTELELAMANLKQVSKKPTDLEEAMAKLKQVGSRHG